MGIAHFEDLSVDNILSLLDLKWSAAEKLDGSYLKLGLDDEGRPYVARHNGIKLYSLDDWPNECWTSGYRPAHLTAFFFLDTLKREGAIGPGDSFGAEIINNRQPNAIEYKMPSGIDGVLWITTADFTPSTTAYVVMQRFDADFSYYHPRSADGLSIEWHEYSVRWAVMPNPPISGNIVDGLAHFTDHIKGAMNFFLDSQSKIANFTVRELLEVNLNKVTKIRRAAVKAERQAVRETWLDLVMLLKKYIGEHLTRTLNGYNSYSFVPEGFVIQSENFLCKVTDRKEFTELNHFVHRVKYMLVGGRRPVRACFLSRTKDWPLERRIARLEVLRNRYLGYYESLYHRYDLFGKSGSMFYSGSLHDRMLSLFADTRKRILDGR